MKNQTRERIGLLIFFVLVLLGGTVLISYFATGLTWTVYATSVDDRVGNMEGYTAVVYRGTVVPDKADESIDVVSENATSNHETDIPAIADTIGLRILSYYPGIHAEGYSGVYISEVRELYTKKDAAVVTIDPQDVLEQPKPRIIRASDKRIGIFGADTYLTKPVLSKIIASLQEEGAEIIVCVTKRMALLADLGGINVVLLTEDSETYSTTGTRIVDTLVVQAPKTGEAGVLFFSNNNVASARSIDML